MNKYYHRGQGECVKERSDCPMYQPKYEKNRCEKDDCSCLIFGEVTAYCSPETLIGWVENCREQYEYKSVNPRISQAWVKCTLEQYETLEPDSRRIFLVENKEGEETKEGLCNAAPVGLTDTQGLLKAATPAVAVSGEELTIDDYKEAFEDHKRLVREIDVILNGEEGAAKQASLCDLVGQIEKLKSTPAPLDEAAKDIRPLDEIEPIELDVFYIGHRDMETVVLNIMDALSDDVANIVISPSKQSLQSSTPVSSEAVDDTPIAEFERAIAKFGIGAAMEYFCTPDDSQEVVRELFTQQKQ